MNIALLIAIGGAILCAIFTIFVATNKKIIKRRWLQSPTPFIIPNK